VERKYVRYNNSEWEDIIKRCKSSGLSDYQWCRDNGIALTSFYRKLKQFRDIHIEPSAQVLPIAKTQESVQEVVPLEVIPDQETQTSYNNEGKVVAARVTVKGMTIEVFNAADPGLIKDIIQCAWGSSC